MTEILFKPRFATRDLTDTLLSVVIGIFQTVVLFVLPALVCYWSTSSGMLAIAFGVALYALFALCCVSNVIISPTGIRFTRIFGIPKFIAWADISSIHEVSRGELIWRGWLWPIFPPRELTPTLTSLGHYRIQFGKQSVYFPPADPAAFMAAVGTHLPGRV